MIIDLKKLRASGKQTTDFYFEPCLQDNLSDIPNTQIVQPIKVVGSVTLAELHSAYIEGEINFKISGACTRCLEPTEKEYTAEFSEHVCADNDGGYLVVNDKVDLEKIVSDKILMSLPINFLCKDDCKGICVDCGANLNQEECKCKK